MPNRSVATQDHIRVHAGEVRGNGRQNGIPKLIVHSSFLEVPIVPKLCQSWTYLWNHTGVVVLSLNTIAVREISSSIVYLNTLIIYIYRHT
jgi:hypothetical protein